MNARRLGLEISLLLVLGAAAAARAQPAPRIPLKDFFDNPKISSAAISPDGRQLAFLAPEGSRMNVWVGDVVRSLDSARAITHDTQRGIMHFVWTRDSRYVLFEQDWDGDENFHLFRADPLHSDAKAVDLTPMAGARAEVIDLPRGRPGEVIVAINARDKRYFDAYRLDLETGELQLIEENPGDVDAWHVDSNRSSTVWRPF
jgi:Tol biopolymer transport system component